MSHTSFLSELAKKNRLLTILLLLLSVNLYGQQKIILQDQQHPNREKKLNTDCFFALTTVNGKIDYCQIGALNDSTLTIHSWKCGVDTIFTIATNQVTKIELDRGGDQRLLLPAMLASMGGVAAISIPIQAAKGNTESARAGLIVLGTIESVCLSILYFGNRNSSYDLVNKWSVKVVGN